MRPARRWPSGAAAEETLGEREQASSQNPRAARIALVACGVLGLAGLGVSLELTRVYQMARTDPDYHSFCAVSEAVNCETVALSPWATVLGVPTSVWASAGYVFATLLAFACACRPRERFGLGFLGLTGLVFTGVSAVLAFVMAAVIGSLCLLCLALDVVNVGVLTMALVALRGAGLSFKGAIAGDVGALVRGRVHALAVGVLAIGVVAGAVAYGSRIVDVVRPDVADSRPAGDRRESLTHPSTPECGPGESSAPSPPQIRTGVSAEGHPWVGAESPIVEVHEFTDYQCPHCRKAHLLVRRLISEFPDRLRVYHRHFPLDHHCNPAVEEPFHPRACELARIAVCAGRQGRFFEMNDFLFQHADEIRDRDLDAGEIARRLELDLDRFRCCLDEVSVREAVARDIADGRALGIEGTPAFVVEGRVHYGRIPGDVLDRLRAAGRP